MIQLSLFLQSLSVLENFYIMYIIYFISPTVSRIIVTLPFNILFIAFSLYYFFNSKPCFISFFQFFSVMRFTNNFFTIKTTNNICPQNSIFNFYNDKSFFQPIWKVIFCKESFLFWYSCMITNFKFRTFFAVLFIEINCLACD